MLCWFVMIESAAPPPVPGPDERPTDDQGVDLTLIRETLRMTPTERLLALQTWMNTLANVRVVRRAP